MKLNAQNLVPNPSFELHTMCPTGQDQLFKSKYWYKPTANSSDYYHACYNGTSNTPVDVPQNFAGWQHPRTGNAYAGIGTSAFEPQVNYNAREYISSRLFDSLQVGKRYCIEFFISLADSSVYAMDRLGVYFFNDSTVDMSTIDYLPYVPQVETDSGLVFNDTSAWTKISGSFVAQGGERYFMIGNFHSDSATALDTFPAGTWYWAYYYIDDVSVYLCEDTLPVPEEITLTPSPSNGIVQLKGNFPGGAELKLYDMLGQSAGVISIEDGVCDRTLFLPFASGIYLYRIESGDMLLQSGKLLIGK